MICMISETTHNILWVVFFIITYGPWLYFMYIEGMFDRVLAGLKRITKPKNSPERP